MRAPVRQARRAESGQRYPGLVAVIPALDEEGSIGDVVGELRRRGVPIVLVADNDSRDATASVARAAGAHVVDAPQRGYGAACQAALAALPSDAQAVLFCDADGADDLERLDDLVLPVLDGRRDLMIGSRALGERERHALSLPQVVGNLAATLMMRALYRVRVTDLGPFRCVSRVALERLRMRDTAYGWTAEMQVKAYRHGMQVREVPVRALRRRAGVSKISGRLLPVLRAGRAIIATILRYAFEASDRQRAGSINGVA